MRAAENLTDAPPIAAVMNLRAYEAYPFDPHVRLQLFKTMVRGHSTELVNASPKVMDRLYAMARQLAHGPTLAYGAGKQLFHHSLGESLEGQMELETQAIARSGKTEDFRSGVTAFAEKKAATFKGR